MIVAEQKKKMKRCPVSMQPDIENLLNDLSPEDFSKASKEEKDDFIPVSYTHLKSFLTRSFQARLPHTGTVFSWSVQL